MTKSILSLVIIGFGIMIPTSNLRSEERALSEVRADVNSAEEGLIGKFAEEAVRLERGTAKALKAEALRDKKILAAKNNTQKDSPSSAPSIESIKADLQEREAIASQIEHD